MYMIISIAYIKRPVRDSQRDRYWATNTCVAASTGGKHYYYCPPTAQHACGKAW